MSEYACAAGKNFELDVVLNRLPHHHLGCLTAAVLSFFLFVTLIPVSWKRQKLEILKAC